MPFVLGMEVPRRAHTQLDLKACMLTLFCDDGSIAEVLGLYEQTKELWSAVLAQMQVLET